MAEILSPIPYQGSKRKLASRIVSLFPASDSLRLFEPFCGSAAVSIRALSETRCAEVMLNDSNEPLANLWTEIIERPEALADAYEHMWTSQLGNERAYYDTVRERFNQTRKAPLLLFLLARCVKASVRYNNSGEFNQSADNRRRGATPERMRARISSVSGLMRSRVLVSSGDYLDAVKDAIESDLIYMDPPYQGVSGHRDSRYESTMEFKTFIEGLEALNERGLSYIVSYDGRTGDRSYGKPLPSALKLTKFEVEAGRSTQATLNGHAHETIESVYLSAPLVERLADRYPKPSRPEQLSVLEYAT